MSTMASILKATDSSETTSFDGQQVGIKEQHGLRWMLEDKEV